VNFMALPFSLHRTIILAPHPDDDVIAAGGLIQRVLAMGGEVRVVFITDGENNPWPQRFTERKFFLAAGDRQTWGAMRRQEALCSLSRLGVNQSSAIFLGLPDQGISALARRGDGRLCDALIKVVTDFQPTLIISPSTFDLHADHRAIAYFAHQAAPDGAITTYVVHGDGPVARRACEVELLDYEQKRKREAIECHVSQLALSRDRFLSYARQSESFYVPEHDVVRIESTAREWLIAFRHSLRVLFGTYPSAVESGVQPAADIQDGASDVAGLL
jgi:LmbE family N-acetylglucosaminyl deacetylase